MIIATLAVIAAGCTQNNGNIGDWFGTWKLEEITIDGIPDLNYPGNIFWKFQAHIIDMVQVYDQVHNADSRYGTWEEGQGYLLLNYSHSDDNYGPGEGIYKPLSATHIPPGKTMLKILRHTGVDLWLVYISDDGIKYEYIFRKWG